MTETLGQGAETLVLSDSLGAQVSARFKTEMTTQGAHLVQGPKNGTYIWQPCDHHVGARYKYLMGLIILWCTTSQRTPRVNCPRPFVAFC